MDIKIDDTEIISLNEFSLGWRFDEIHNSDISENEKSQIKPLSEDESRKINKVIDYFENESNRIDSFSETKWFSANQESESNIERFRTHIDNHLKPFDEDLIISWNRKTVLKTSKQIFLKFWTDFLYPSSDDVTIISEKTNWILFYRHYEVANIWIRKL